jgi:hypothetical protein
MPVHKCCIIPSFQKKNNPSLLLDSIYETNTTFLIASPSLLNQFWLKRNKNRLARVNCVLSTGSNLSTHLKKHFWKTNKRILNYGLTETTGFVLENLKFVNFNGNTMGDCIAQIVDENNHVKTNWMGTKTHKDMTTVNTQYWLIHRKIQLKK